MEWTGRKRNIFDFLIFRLLVEEKKPEAASNQTPKNFNTQGGNIALGMNNYSSKWSMYKSDNSNIGENHISSQPGLNKKGSMSSLPKNFNPEVTNKLIFLIFFI
jgi:hypothetical protein